jgi:hypothetical protein
MGSRNKVNGQRNWVFSTNYDGTADRVLVLGQWKIELERIEDIRVDPALAISKW